MTEKMITTTGPTTPIQLLKSQIKVKITAISAVEPRTMRSEITILFIWAPRAGVPVTMILKSGASYCAMMARMLSVTFITSPSYMSTGYTVRTAC